MACQGEPSPQTATSLQRIVLVPPSATVVTSDTVRFSVTGRMSDGSTVAAAATYLASGGTITSGGLYTAGGVSGGYRVIATVIGGTLADSSDITVIPPGAHSYSTLFPLTESPISEGGHWINGGAVGLDWTNVSTTPGLAIGHQVGASYTDATALLTGTWGSDQTASATVYSVQPNDACSQEVELRLRSAIAAHVNTGYEISYKASPSASAYLIIVRWNGALGDFTYLSNNIGAQFGVKNGDVVSASIVGHVITAYKNGAQMAQATDSTFSAGSPGMGFNLENAPTGCAGTNGDYGFTTYSASDFVAASTIHSIRVPASSPR
jgi:hypothetical protein